MLDLLFRRTHVRVRLQSGPLGPYLEALASYLWEKCYRAPTIRRYIRSAELVCLWLRRRKLRVRDATSAAIDRYIRQLGRNPCPGRLHGRLPEAALRLMQFLEVLRMQGVIASASAQPPLGDKWLIRFESHLNRVGLADGTRAVYLRYAQAFLKSCPGPDPSKLTAEDVSGFVLERVSRLKPSSSRLPVSATRAFLCFLVSQNVVSAGLEYAAPTVRQWKLASLPNHLSEETVTGVLAHCDGTTVVRQRARAILLLLARLGVRAGEISQLVLDDIDWRTGQVLIRSAKSDRDRILPLPQEVGESLVCYLQSGRPASPSRRIFLRCRAPYIPLTSPAVSNVARRALKRAGVSGVRLGSHVFRHSAATAMVRQGSSFKEVADVLGHQRLETTAIYAKLDVSRLARVALPWPGGTDE